MVIVLDFSSIVLKLRFCLHFIGHLLYKGSFIKYYGNRSEFYTL